MGGALKVESQLGVGSCFTFTIPFLKADEELSETTGADTETLLDFAGLRLLLVDDIALNRLILIESLADTGIAVTEAGDGVEALKIFEQSTEGYFDVVFMDVQMPHMDGYQATEAIRALPRKDSDLPVIAMTANALKEDVEQALAHGMTEHISKPVDLDACARTLAKIAETKRTAKSGRDGNAEK
jgi:CheY-like chemotaxis protein